MSPRSLILAMVALAAAACGNKIGDACVTATDCSQDGDRICDFASNEGYCTIEGCDFNTCPADSVCVRFFPGLQGATDCSVGGQADCAVDEICTIGKECAPRSIERRYCMATCSDGSDCRDSYECRDKPRQAAHGGEPVPDPDHPAQGVPDVSYCGSGKPCVLDTDCDLGDHCNLDLRTCQP